MLLSTSHPTADRQRKDLIPVTTLFERTTRRRLIATTGVMIAALALSGCAASSEGSAAADDSSIETSDEACERNKAAGTITYISGYGYSASAGQMDVFVADELGYFDALCLDVEINASGANGQQLVSSGQAQFTALGSASDVMLAAANSDNLTAIATYGDTSPFSIFANENISSLKDLEGAKLGYFINITPIALAMLDAADVDVDKIELVKMTNYDPTVVTRGQVDAIVGYASNQPEKLRSMDLPFNEFVPADYGIDGTYNVMEANTRFLDENPEVAADFMRADLKALQYCLDNPDECVDLMSVLAEDSNQGSAFPKDQLARTWAVESQWVVGDGEGNPLGVHTEADWQPEYELVQEFGGVTSLPALGSMMDTQLVASLYGDDQQLLWPEG